MLRAWASDVRRLRKLKERPIPSRMGGQGIGRRSRQPPAAAPRPAMPALIRCLCLRTLRFPHRSRCTAEGRMLARAPGGVYARVKRGTPGCRLGNPSAIQAASKRSLKGLKRVGAAAPRSKRVLNPPMGE